MPRALPQLPVTSKYFLPPKVNLEQPHVGAGGAGCEGGDGGGGGGDGGDGGASGGDGDDGGDGGDDGGLGRFRNGLIPAPPMRKRLGVPAAMAFAERTM